MVSKRTALRMAYGGPRVLTPAYYRHVASSWRRALHLWRLSW